MHIDTPSVVAELTAAFSAYEAALIANDVAVLTELFWDHDKTIRYGGGENLYGSAEIEAFRRARPGTGLDRELGRTVITTFGQDFGTASTLFRNRSTGRTGRQMQSWVRLDGHWRIVAAHVSMLDFPFPTTTPETAL